MSKKAITVKLLLELSQNFSLISKVWERVT